MTTPADTTDAAIASMEFIAPLGATFVLVASTVLMFRWVRSIGRWYS